MISDERTRRFEQATMPHFDAAYAYARFLLRSTADAEDAVQECYLLALRHYDSFRGQTIKPWLFSILRNVCYTEFARRTKANLDAEASAEEDPESLLWRDQEATAELALQQRQESDIFRKLVEAMPVIFRDVIVLRELEELSYREIAEIAGAPIGTVMSRLARAREILRKAWIDLGCAAPPIIASADGDQA